MPKHESHDVRPMCPAETAAEIAFWVAQDIGREFSIVCGGCIIFTATKDSRPDEILRTHYQTCTQENRDPEFVFRLSPSPSATQLCAAQRTAPRNVEPFLYLATTFFLSSLNLTGFLADLLLVTSNVNSPFSMFTLTTPPERTLLITIIVATGFRIFS